ncbi:hypothetical protein [Pontibacter sp. G13]|uniref:hypothetical protein n=1 Tax=Pontibacter sp. G13 TaxID=3074898 RepID=UPI00288A39B6|nr:hypothetical protein [Pontibacter sp. G13]WNJ17453.1 hypothetical protein RJD25_21610 [Pontibacter sp. G13]
MISNWLDLAYLKEFFDSNFHQVPSGLDLQRFTTQVLQEQAELVDFLFRQSEVDDSQLDRFFVPLNNQEFILKPIALRKGKARKRKSLLRIYAVRIDVNCFVITGGAIKVTQAMQEASHTRKELARLRLVADYLKDHGAYDLDLFLSFLELDEDD